MSTNTVCEKDACAGCYACVASCKMKAIQVEDNLKSLNAYIDNEKCVHCGKCMRICPNHSSVKMTRPVLWRQGWVNDERIRSRSTSGGAARAFMEYIVSHDGIVFSCVVENGQFIFRGIDNNNDLDSFVGSKYVKSNPMDAYTDMQKQLSTGRKVLFIGLPCQVAAVQNLMGNYNNLITVDLICHGTPSVKMLDFFLKEKGHSLSSIRDIQFRYSYKLKNCTNLKNIVPDNVEDEYTKAFKESITLTENCYSCKYAGIERASDITIGDSWGSELDTQEKRKGISLILCQTPKGVELLDAVNMRLYDVDLAKAIQNNSQLEKPTSKPLERTRFFNEFEKRTSMTHATHTIYPVFFIKQGIKNVLIHLRVKKYQKPGDYHIEFIET